MRKEIILAIVLGVILGVVIVFGINLANQSANNTDLPNQTTSPTTQLTPTPTPTLQITSPLNNSVSFEETITLTGKTMQNAWVALIWEDDETIIKSDETGIFEQEINLVGGENIIKVTASDGLSYQEETEIIVIYTTAERE